MADDREENAQIIYDLRRQLETARAAEDFLNQELQQLQATRDLADEKAHQHQQEWHRKQAHLTVQLAELQQSYESATEEIFELRRQLQVELAQRSAAEPALAKDTTSTNGNNDERLAELELETQELLQQIMESNARDVQHMLVVAEKERKIEILTDEVHCLRENLQCKRLELEEKTQLLESAQDLLAETNAKVTMLTAAPNNVDRKGNSLFAEVDDQRQAMKQLLAQQKKTYLQMKKVYNESEQEIRRLKRENNAMQGELKTCTAIFIKADKTYQEKLQNRIKRLNQHNEDLQRQLNWTQERLKDMAIKSDLSWIESLLEHCKTNSNDLKVEMHSMRIQMSSLEEQLRNMTQDMARWRFETIKVRCLVIERENLLTEHNIAFPPVAETQFKINKELLTTQQFCLTYHQPVTASALQNVKQLAPTSDGIPPALALAVFEDDDCNKENTPSTAKSSRSTPFASRGGTKQPSPSMDSPPLGASTSATYNEEALTSQLKNEDGEIKAPPPPLRANWSGNEQPGPSILSKKCLLFGDATKQVKFSSNADTVHNITPMNVAATISGEGKVVTNLSNSKVTVRRVVVKSEKKPLTFAKT